MTMSRFKSQRLSGHRVTLAFGRITDTYWVEAGVLRSFVAELDRLEVANDTAIELRHRTDNDELPPVGWSLNITVPDAPTDTIASPWPVRRTP